ncbi:hypothetical protein BBJ29_009223 [Phytophthora kernoviae]|uniref:Uncharacterized protein n=1 Tax=Phytophthora kernoviae TaxID=325452 RepID=A0A3F2RIA0_9STRA|nr:hypothetical protein BBP00_00007611 [Phytophthora kernoviae]RLN71296.1 hypothetical protein BBJ29_009223 [Phytophthora kernoviae]
MKRTTTKREIAAKKQECFRLQLQRLCRRLAVMTEALEHVFQFHFQLDQCIAEPELETPDDVLWLWSGALTSRSITFKFGLREGYTCSDLDFVLYAFPELGEGERPHSAIATCSDVDGGVPGVGENLSPAALDTPNVKQCEFTDLPHSNRKYRYELTLLRTDEDSDPKVKFR